MGMARSEVGDWTALMANFGEMATVGAAVKEDCDFGKAGRASRRSLCRCVAGVIQLLWLMFGLVSFGFVGRFVSWLELGAWLLFLMAWFPKNWHC